MKTEIETENVLNYLATHFCRIASLLSYHLHLEPVGDHKSYLSRFAPSTRMVPSTGPPEALFAQPVRFPIYLSNSAKSQYH